LVMMEAKIKINQKIRTKIKIRRRRRIKIKIGKIVLRNMSTSCVINDV
jgi:hypothetical protein